MNNTKTSSTAAASPLSAIDYKTGVAVGSKTRLNISENHITTMDFGFMKPVYCRLLLPDEDITVQTEQFTRLKPMPAPTFGSIRNKTRAFFVPMRVLSRQWLNFISNNFDWTASSDGSIDGVPNIARFSWQDFCNWYFGLEDMSDHLSNGELVNVTSLSAADKSVLLPLYNDGGVRNTQYMWKPNQRGRKVLDIMHCLGYNLPLLYITSASIKHHTQLSPYPLIALGKLYTDWVVPSRFMANHLFLRNFVNQFDSNDLANNNFYVEPDYLEALFESLYHVYYDDDIFVTSFTNMNGDETPRPYNTSVITLDSSRLEQRNSAHTFSDSTDGTFTGEQRNAGIGAYYDVNGAEGILNHLTLQSLGALQSMINRGKLAGTKIQEYMKVTYGIEPFSESLNLSTYLGAHSNEIQIGDVYATAGTSENALGDYAGRGIGYNSDTFKFHAKEHGFFIMTNEIIPVASYPWGTHYDNLVIDREDFYQPELDNLGYESIAQMQIKGDCPRDDTKTLGNLLNTFSFTPRYSGFKFGQDNVTGDFRFNDRNLDLMPFFMARDLQSHTGSLDENFLIPNRNGEYDKIFASGSVGNEDHFIQIFKHHVIRSTYLKPLSLSLSEHGRPVSVSPNN